MTSQNLSVSLDSILRARETVLSGRELSREDALHLAGTPDSLIPYLAATANEVRLRFAGNSVESCALSNIKSGNCSEDCKFCSQSGHYKTESPVYPQISVEEIVRQAKTAESSGATEFCLVTSGWGMTNEREFTVVLEAVRRLTKETKMYIDASLGFL